MTLRVYTGGWQPIGSQLAATRIPPRRYAAPRGPNRYEALVDFAAVTRSLDQIEASMRLRLVPLLEGARDRLKAKIAREGATLAAADMLGQVLKFGEVRAAFRDGLGEALDQGRRALRREIKAARAMASPGYSPTAAMAYLKQKSLWITGVLDDQIVNKAKGIIIRAVRVGENPRETQTRLGALFDPYIGDETVLRGGAPLSPFRLETILRTNATDAFNQGRLVEIRDPDLAELIPAVEYSAIIDERTTEVCKYLDERLFDRDSAYLDQLSPPRHFNCRSLLVAVTIDMEREREDFITGAEAEHAKELSGDGF